MSINIKIKILFFIILFFLLQDHVCYSQTGWINQNSGVITDLKSVDFVDSLIGFCVGDSGRILKTINGGISWDIISTGYLSNLNSVEFVNSNTGFAVGNIGSILKTINGGTIWIDEGVNSYDLDQVFFVNEQYGFITSIISSYFYRTTNGGITWDSSFTFTSLKKIFFLNENVGWGIGIGLSGNIVYKTSNSGINWQLNIYNGQNDIINSLFFIDTLKGWLGSPHFTGPTIFRTTNSGSNWLPFFPSTQSTSNSIFFINSIKGWACGTNDVIIFTNNGGINWSHQLPFMPNKIYNSIYFTDSLTGWVVGDSGIILKTTTGGVLTNFSNISSEIPDKFSLSQNFPNPFNPRTVISYELRITSNAELKVYDVLGNEVAELVNEKQNAGSYSVEFDGSNFASGIYFYSLIIDGVIIDTKRMILLK